MSKLGRPPLPDGERKKTITVYLGTKTVERIEQQAARAGVSRNKVIADALAGYFAELARGSGKFTVTRVDQAVDPARAKALGVTIKPSTRVTGLLKNGQAIAGAVLEEEGEETEVFAPALAAWSAQAEAAAAR